MPHKHSPNSKHERQKQARQELLGELRLITKVYDHENGECIATQDSEHFCRGEVIYGPNFQSPSIGRASSGEWE
jgi:hypothetical protein